MITIQQIKAARALLNWNQDDLAKAANVSKPAIANLERGTAQPRIETLNAITRAMEEGGVEFIDGPGVRLRKELLKVDVFQGKNAVYRLWEDIAASLPQGGERLINGIDERMFDAVAGGLGFRRAMKKLEDQRNTARILLKEGDTYFVLSKESYRWVPEALFSSVPYYIYGNKYAIYIMEPEQKVVLIENKAIADSYRKQFDFLWDNARIPD